MISSVSFAQGPTLSFTSTDLTYQQLMAMMFKCSRDGKMYPKSEIKMLPNGEAIALKNLEEGAEPTPEAPAEPETPSTPEEEPEKDEDTTPEPPEEEKEEE